MISERIFRLLESRGISQSRFSGMTGISAQTISDWRRKKTNPSAEKIMPVCRALGITPEMLLTGEGLDPAEEAEVQPLAEERIQEEKLLEAYRSLSAADKKRLTAYIAALGRIDRLEKEKIHEDTSV